MCEGFLELSKLTLTGKIMFQCTDKRNEAVYLIMYLIADKNNPPSTYSCFNTQSVDGEGL